VPPPGEFCWQLRAPIGTGRDCPHGADTRPDCTHSLGQSVSLTGMSHVWCAPVALPWVAACLLASRDPDAVQAGNATPTIPLHPQQVSARRGGTAADPCGAAAGATAAGRTAAWGGKRCCATKRWVSNPLPLLCSDAAAQLPTGLKATDAPASDCCVASSAMLRILLALTLVRLWSSTGLANSWSTILLGPMSANMRADPRGTNPAGGAAGPGLPAGARGVRSAL